MYSGILGIKENALITEYVYLIVEVNEWCKSASASLIPWSTSFEFTTSRISFLAIKKRNKGMKFECNGKLTNYLHARKFEHWMLKYDRFPTASARMQVTSRRFTCSFQLFFFISEEAVDPQHLLSLAPQLQFNPYICNSLRSLTNSNAQNKMQIWNIICTNWECNRVHSSWEFDVFGLIRLFEFFQNRGHFHPSAQYFNQIFITINSKTDIRFLMLFNTINYK